MFLEHNSRSQSLLDQPQKIAELIDAQMANWASGGGPAIYKG
jgi:hypothetical protein